MQIQLVLVVLEVIAALLGGPAREVLRDRLPVPAVRLEQLDELVLLVLLPLVLRLDARAEQSGLVDRARAEYGVVGALRGWLLLLLHCYRFFFHFFFDYFYLLAKDDTAQVLDLLDRGDFGGATAAVICDLLSQPLFFSLAY